MSKIAFFCIPAYGHTNPTLEVVKELISKGNEVWYYSYEMLREKIEETGAKYISCEDYETEMIFKPEDADRAGKDIAFFTKTLVNATLAMNDAIIEEMKAWNPDCIVSDAMAFWGKLIALKLGIPFVSSTTTFAINKYSVKTMKQSFFGLIKAFYSIRKANKHVKKLKDKGYLVKNVLSLIQNNNDTDTIVYTSPEFQPFSETFSKKYSFVGPIIRKLDYEVKKPVKKTIYISLGTVNNQVLSFFQNCIAAFKDEGFDVIMSVGNMIDLDLLGEIPANITVKKSVNQIEVLQQADAFLTHCGMNSVSEGLYYHVPLILFPQSSEQGGVAYRVNELKAGIYLKENSVEAIRQAVNEVLSNNSYRENAKKIAESFYRCGGAKEAADKILNVARGK